MYDVVNISRFIQELRKEHNFTQKYVAEKLNVSVQAVSKWETGKSCPDIDLYIPLSELFGITVVELMKGHRINPEELKEETAETIVNVVSKSNKIIKCAVITGVVLVVLIILGCMVYNVYKIHANRLADLISFSYSDDNFKISDLFLSVSNDYKNQNYFGGKIEFLNNMVTTNTEGVYVKFCYINERCYDIFTKNSKGLGQEYYLYTSNIGKILDSNKKIKNIKEFENILYRVSIIIHFRYSDGTESDYILPLNLNFILHNHSNMFQI